MPENTLNNQQSRHLSLIIPVYNSASIVGDTIDETVAFCEAHQPDYELILVNDGSRDDSWDIVRAKAADNPHIIAIDLLKNYGQHTAVFCGLRLSSGDYVVTLDDDLQNPPGEIIHLLGAAEDHDLVFGRFRRKQHASHRRLGSWLVLQLNRRLFKCPPDIVVSNFRLLRRDVADRISNHRTPFPYITGLCLMYATSPGNVWVEHHPRPVGSSNYNLFKLMRLVLRIVFSYSSYPMWIVAIFGGGLVVVNFLIALGLITVWVVTGQPTDSALLVLTLFSIFTGLLTLIAMAAITGEYVVRLLRWMTGVDNYIINQRIN